MQRNNVLTFHVFCTEKRPVSSSSFRNASQHNNNTSTQQQSNLHSSDQKELEEAREVRYIYTDNILDLNH